MNTNTVRLTKEIIHAASSHPTGNGFTKTQLSVFGIAYPPKQGWLRSLIGKEVSLDILAAFRIAGDERRRKNWIKVSASGITYDAIKRAAKAESGALEPDAKTP